jgi:hypothetical protein
MSLLVVIFAIANDNSSLQNGQSQARAAAL